MPTNAMLRNCEFDNALEPSSMVLIEGHRNSINSGVFSSEKFNPTKFEYLVVHVMFT